MLFHEAACRSRHSRVAGLLGVWHHPAVLACGASVRGSLARTWAARVFLYPAGVGWIHRGCVSDHVAVPVWAFLRELVRLGAGGRVLLVWLFDLFGGVSEFPSHTGLRAGRTRARSASPATGHERYSLTRASSHLPWASLRDSCLVRRYRLDRAICVGGVRRHHRSRDDSPGRPRTGRTLWRGVSRVPGASAGSYPKISRLSSYHGFTRMNTDL